MMKVIGAGIASAAVLATAYAGYRLGAWSQTGIVAAVPAPVTPAVAQERKILYWQAPGGEPDFSATPKTAADGRPYMPVYDEVETKAPGTEASTRSQGAGKVKFYRNPMGLPDTSPTPKKDSMGMDYIPVFEGDGDDSGTIRLSPAKIQRTGVETAVVTRQKNTRTIKAPGVVQFDERRIAVIAPRFDGYVEHIEPVTTGGHVHRGDPLAAVFGEDLLTQGARLVLEQSSGWKPEDSPGPRASAEGTANTAGAALRLHHLGASDEFIAEIRRTRRVPETLTLRAPFDGAILERNIVEGQSFKAGDILFKIADHSVMWVNADVSEGDMEAVKPGQAVSVTSRAHPGRIFAGTVALILPHLMKETRTARVRIELPNADLALLPDMYTDVEIATGEGGSALTVSTSAVIDGANRKVVLVSLGEGRYEPRDVKVGRTGDGVVEILSGLAEGDKVVVNGLFLIDSESNLQAALKGLSPTTPAESKP